MQDVFLTAELTPTQVRVADSTEFVIKLVVGPGYASGPSRIIYDFSSTLGTSCPTTFVNEASGYVEAYVSNPYVTYLKRCWDLDRQAFATREHPPSREAQRMVVLDLSEGLREGDLIELHWGDVYGGFGPGAKVTSVTPRRDFEGSIHVRYFDSQDRGAPDMGFSCKGCPRPAPDCDVRLAYRVLPRAPHHLRLLRKTDKAMLIAHDMFWNVAAVEDAAELVEAKDAPAANVAGVFEYADKNVRVASKSLPLLSTPSMARVFGDMNLYWGDVHTHSAFSIDCARRARMDMTPGDLMEFARRRAGLDFFAVTDHHLPSRGEHFKISRTNWERTMEAAGAHNAPGEFVVFAGLEFGGTRGDTAFVFNWLPDYEELDRDDWTDIRKVWQALRGKDYMSIPHFHGPGQLAEGEWWRNEDLACEPVLEIFSDHGSYEREDALENGRALCKSFRWDRCGVHFLKNGCHYGFVANSDDHKGHVGVNGVTAVFAETLDRQSIFEAYRQRRVYATTNARIRLLFAANGRLMGAVLPNCEHKELTIDAVGENTLKKVDLFRNGDLYKRFVPEGRRFERTVTVREDEPSNWYVRVTQLDNHIAFSSPIWFE